MSSLDRTASSTPARDGSERKKSVSKAWTLICAKKSKADEVGPAEVAQGSGAARSCAASAARVARDSSVESCSTTSPRDVSHGSRARKSGAASSEREQAR